MNIKMSTCLKLTALFIIPLMAGTTAMAARAKSPVLHGSGSKFFSPYEGRVMTGYDVLEKKDFNILKGRNIGLVVNHSSINREGEHLLDKLYEHPDINVVAVFAPEHGIRGTEDRHIDNETDEKTGLPIYSLYGVTRRPTDEMLAGIDTFVFDIQDIGARFYTYIATMGNCMEVAARFNKRIVVLDRPNPIAPLGFDGPVQDGDLTGKFTNFRLMPTMHGMTVGEIALMYNKHYDIGAKLEVVKMKNWRRNMFFDECDLPWVNPSPNMRSVDEEILYTMVALVEANKDISVGRGTDRPFEYMGAPWMDKDELAAEMNSRDLPGLWFMPTTFIPSDVDITGRETYKYPYHGQTCEGFRVVVTNRWEVEPVEAGIHMIDALMRLYPEEFSAQRLRGLVGAQWVLDALKRQVPPAEIAKQWRDEDRFKDFAKYRRKYLLYK